MPHDEKLIGSRQTFGSVTDKISAIVQSGGLPRFWLIGFSAAFSLTMLLLVSVVWLFTRGVGIWGINIPVAWGFAITNFVWWIGIGHAGTLISAVMLLLKQEWRTSINRFAEAMTLFAVSCAGLYPLIHLGRPQYFYWLIPVPNTMGVWPQFRSPLMWDFFAVSTYATVSFLFWYIGLIPDLATLRDRSTHSFGRIAYGILAMGWRGSAKHWKRYKIAYLLLAGLATPLVVSVHTIVSFDFSAGIPAGWHSTIFPPYFVAGAIFSGFAMVLTLAIPLRYFYKLQDFVTDAHLEAMAKVMLGTGLIVAYGYLMENFMAWYSDNDFEKSMVLTRVFGPYAPVYWGTILCNVILPQALWFKSVRRGPWKLFAIAIIVNVGMWLERFMIVVTSLHHDFLPSSWGMFYPTFWDFATFFGTVGLFFTLFFLFVRFLPMISIAEMRELVSEHTPPSEQKELGAEAQSADVPSPRSWGRGQQGEGQFNTTGPAIPHPCPSPPTAGRGNPVYAPLALPPPRSSIFPSYGVMAEFDSPDKLVAAAHRAREEGYKRMDAYSPFPVEGLAEALNFKSRWVARLVFCGGVCGAIGGYALQYYCAVLAYPLDVGGRPLNSWPAFIPVTFETTVLCAALCAVLGMLLLNGLPLPYHPAFNVPRFALASRDRFFLLIEARDKNFEVEKTSRFLCALNAYEVSEVQP